MGSTSQNTTGYFYKDRPLFGLDIGFSSLKVLQLDTIGKKKHVSGYGATSFDAKALDAGVVVDPELIASAAYELFANNLIGKISSRRVAIAIPAAHTFSRSVKLPKMAAKDIMEALRLEAEQYIPLPTNDLYMDYEIISKSEKELELLSVAVPKKIVDSYMTLARLLNLEVVTIEPTINASGRLFVQAEQSDIPTILIDFGSISSDITIYDKGLIITGTVPGGGDSFTQLIADKLGVSKQEGHIIKTKYGMGVSKKQKEITEAMTPLLEKLLKEIRRMVRYYEERSANQGKIGQIVTMGGGANMPGLSDYMTNALRLPVRMCDPWQHMDFGKLPPPNSVEKSMYVTVAGLALIKPQEIFV